MGYAVRALAMFGGNWTNDSNAGISYWNLNNSSGNANSNIGARHLIKYKYIKIIAPHNPYRLVKIRPLRAGFSRNSLEKP